MPPKGTLAWLLIAALWVPPAATAQRGRSGRATTTPPKIEPAVVECPSPLGEGVQTRRMFCDVLTGRDPAGGIIIKLPAHTGPMTLTFDLHNRHTYSEELIKTRRAYRHYTATIGVLYADNTLLSRFVVQNEFRTAADLIDRVVGDVGPGGLKAVAPTGSEFIRVDIAASEDMVSILGEKLAIVRPDSVAPDTFSAPGRPIAVISNVMLEYRPAPAGRRGATPRR